jgi:hypothetical protein
MRLYCRSGWHSLVIGMQNREGGIRFLLRLNDLSTANSYGHILRYCKVMTLIEGDLLDAFVTKTRGTKF